MELTVENIQLALQQASDHLEANGLDTEQRKRFCLLLEDNLIEYRQFAPNASFRIHCRRLRKRVSVTVYIACGSMNPFELGQSFIADSLQEHMKRMPSWKYRRGENIITYEPITPRPDMRDVKYVWSYLGREKRSFGWAVALRFVNMALSVLEPVFSAWIIVGYSDSDVNKILYVAGLLLVRAVASSIVNFFSSRMLRETYSAVIKSMQNDLAEHILKIRTDCVDRSCVGVFSQRLISETTDFVDNVDELLGIFTEAFRLVSLLISYAMVSWPMLLFEIFLFVVHILIQRHHSRNLQDDGRKCRAADEKRSSFVNEMVRAHRDIKLLHCEPSFREKLSQSIDNSTNLLTAMRVKSMKFILLRTQFTAWTDFAYMAMLALLISRYGVPPSTALVLYNYNSTAVSSGRSLASLVSTLYSIGLSAERISNLMHSRDFAEEVFGDVHLDQVKGDLEFRNVFFSYRNPEGNTKVLKGLSMEVRAGESVALVGGSGCGKSTILSLLTRLYDPDRGRILLDGVELATLDQDTLRGNISMVSQSPYIFNMSVRDNLATVNRDLTDEEIREACRIACIHDDIMSFPEGYDTVVGEGGVMMSGGQRQRLALARCLLCNSPIIILDEATSALDNITQARISQAIENMHGMHTIITVAHRLSTVIHCDRLFFVADGRIAASGSHQQLMETCEEYRRLYSEETGAA